MYTLIIGLLCFGFGLMAGFVLGLSAMYLAFEREIKHGYVQLSGNRIYKVVKATIQ